ncbi:SPOR domain-containing protein [Sulfitobacter noctilucae]|uniref:SPOR domain-containing protein n=1 Tax=Sulfitobacter noctilucae TaxID=1342302 RepID=UPI001F4CE1D2|nr:SPOR domain-containing protein [Sulfitobacter noctilucae]
MAEYTSSPMAGSSFDESGFEFGLGEPRNQLTTLTNIAGAVVSLALIVGIGVWGYKLLLRDVSGIPVVRAASGEMRIRPEEPGGSQANHQGLSVNAVAAVGSAAAPADRLILAPRPIDLTEEDSVMPAAMVTSKPQVSGADSSSDVSEAAMPVLNADEVTAALESGNVDALVAELTNGVAPMSDLSEAKENEVVAAITETAVAEVTEVERQIAALRTEPGVRQSARPKKRPSNLATATPVAFTSGTNVAATSSEEIDANSLPSGTRLAQLGAFESAAVAREQWDQLHTRFDAYLTGKKRIVQKATSGGRVFYRLRAMGFEDIADARRFCSALVAANADCIPVVTR